MKKKIMVYIVAVSSLYLSISFAGPISDTGQDKCYNNSEETICPQPGEAFYGQDAQYHTRTRSLFTKLDSNAAPLPDSATVWAMMQDNVTGLIWECKTTDGSIHSNDNLYYSPEAPQLISELNAMYFGGFSDWRLPDVKELSYLVNMSRTKPAFEGEYFPNLILYYWAENPDPTGIGETYCRYYVQVQAGYVYNYCHPDSPGGVMAVRGDSSGVINNFFDNSNETVNDTNTGLMWQKYESSETMTWEQSLAFCENLELAGYTDWRLPNAHEMQSLVDYTRYAPSINTAYFPSTIAAYYYTSTTIKSNHAKAWAVDFNLGFVNFYFGNDKSDLYYARCVRGGLTPCASISAVVCSKSGEPTITTVDDCDNDTHGVCPTGYTCVSGNCDDYNDSDPLQWIDTTCPSISAVVCSKSGEPTITTADDCDNDTHGVCPTGYTCVSGNCSDCDDSDPLQWTDCTPTVIKLSSFTATAGAFKVIFKWSTESEIDNAGFNLYRSETENGKYVMINKSLIAAKGSATEGASYSFTDGNVQNRKTYYYKLEDIDLSGKATMHGPVKAQPRLINGLFQ